MSEKVVLNYLKSKQLFSRDADAMELGKVSKGKGKLTGNDKDNAQK